MLALFPCRVELHIESRPGGRRLRADAWSDEISGAAQLVAVRHRLGARLGSYQIQRSPSGAKQPPRKAIQIPKSGSGSAPPSRAYIYY